MIKNFQYKNDLIEIVPNFLEIDFISFIQDYFAIKINSNQVDTNLEEFIYGYKFYSDCLMETILQNSCEYISKLTGLKIVPTYSCTYMYMDGDECNYKCNNFNEISAILSLGTSSEDSQYSINIDANTSIEMNSGDLLIYDTRKFSPFINNIDKKWILISNLNYVDNDGPYKDNIYDKRPYLGFKYFPENINGES